MIQSSVLKRWASSIGVEYREPARIDLFSLPFWTPHDGAQSRFLRNQTREILFGGAAGGGKSDCLLIGALKQIHHPRYNAGLFRRTLADLTKPDGLVERSKLYYPAKGGVYNSTLKRWQFPSGACIYFGGLEREDDKLKYQSSQMQYIGFDELTHFTETQYLYMFSRNRPPDDTTTDLKLYMRAGTNPGGPGHEWVKSRFVLTDIVKQRRYFTRINDKDTAVNKIHPLAVGRLYIPASIDDNPSLDKEKYVASLSQLDSIERARLLAGDWDALYTDDLIYPNWSNEHNISGDADYNPDLDVLWGVDDGYVHKRCVLLAQEWPDGTLRIFDEYYKSGQLHEETVDEILDWSYKRPDVCYYDPSAKLLSASWAQPGHPDIYMHSAYNKVQDGIKAVRREICDGRGVRQLLIHPRCKNLIREITQYRYSDRPDTVSGDMKPTKENDDAVDCLRYIIATHRAWRYDD